MHNSGKLVDLSSALLSAGLARLHPTFNAERQPGGKELLELEQAAKQQRLKVRKTNTTFETRTVSRTPPSMRSASRRQGAAGTGAGRQAAVPQDACGRMI